MPSYLQIENISKSYGPKVLFDHISFNINEGDKVALIAPNGTGKTSLLRILAGKDKSDSGGSVKFLRQIEIAFLEQEYDYDPESSVDSSIRRFTDGLTPEAVADYELRIRRYLSDFALDSAQKMGQLSGGEVKRVALVELLARDADFLILDEPTNHLDLDAIEYLETALKRSRSTLFMVTHDRYFLDRVCNTVMEMDSGSVYIYKGDYENYLTKREERVANYNAETEKVRNVLRRELEWMHATPCARSGKAKYRKQAFWELKERSEQVYVRKSVDMSEVKTGTSLRGKVIDCVRASFSYSGQPYLKDFSYKFQRGERVGIVGANGVGKTTFLDLLTGALEPDSGVIERSTTLQIGYYRQRGMEFNPQDTVMDIVPDRHLLSRFLFPADMWNTRVEKLSGGEKRRLYLLTILLQNPNLLILDEPTNDLDIVTLNVLEEYLLEFKGALVIVTHDRHFLDRIAEHLLVFCGEGVVRDFIGGYTEYRSFIKDLEAEKKALGRTSQGPSEGAIQRQQSQRQRPRRLSYREQQEMASLEREMEALNAEKAEIEALLAGTVSDYEAISKASARYSQLKEELDLKELRWLELSEIA
ncbi:MAG: ABC-F family ATP-binding cassette domain-containing protein [Bacteroidales bacterium]|nr:ABC-F family ATP-binding cassette domain-containing protein [Bacteroidales bacterium]